jgi:hypothetical protein
LLKIRYLAGMQIQAPRTVLAEAAMDTLFLSYADPILAAEVILGHFESALHPQQPCMREDGSFNMVADDGRFRDYDSRAREWSSQQDAMHLAPVFCGVVGPDHLEQLRPFLRKPPIHSSGWAPLSWPPVVMTLIGAADVAQMSLDAAELAYRFIDASYRSTDSRELDEHGGLPGVTREYRSGVTAGKWGEIDYVNAGIEGYGWGALSVFLLIRYVMGLREEEPGVITVAPMLPHTLRRYGASYKIAPVQWGKYVLNIECIVRDAGSFAMRLSSTDGEDQPRQWEWTGKWGDARRIQLA